MRTQRESWLVVGLSLAALFGCGDDTAAPTTTGNEGSTTDDSSTSLDWSTTMDSAAADTHATSTTDATGSSGEPETGDDSETTGEPGLDECESGAIAGVRVATFNASMSANDGPLGLAEALAADGGKAPQVAEIIQTVCPDILL
ncbi:MAG: hypothetical protein KC636_16450, partial [Myxococcales bacterium]|nr:hypothetical protein [Myxococcales bacterium]